MRPDPKYTSDSDLESIFSGKEDPVPTGSFALHKTGSLICKVCGESFGRLVDLDRHEFKHTGVKKYKCIHEGCTKMYTNNVHLKRHVKDSHENELEPGKREAKSREHTGPYVCKECGEQFKRLINLDRHEFKHTGIKKHKCTREGCSKTYTNSQHLKRHIQTFHDKKNEWDKNIKCRFDFCTKMFTTNYNMERHIREVHENPKVYECTHCSEKFSQKIKLKRHEVKHTGVYPYNCTVCLKGFVLECYLKTHACLKNYKCDDCEESFAKWSKLLAHRRENHKVMYKCDQCSKQFKTKFFLKEHKNCHADDKEVYRCTYENCNRFYDYKNNLLQHIRIVHEDKKLKCPVESCEMKLCDKRALEHHVKVIHDKKPKVKPKSANKIRKKRKDAGKRKQSTLAKLSGVHIDKDVDKMIMEGTAEVDIPLPALEEEIAATLENASEDSD